MDEENELPAALGSASRAATGSAEKMASPATQEAATEQYLLLRQAYSAAKAAHSVAVSKLTGYALECAQPLGKTVSAVLSHHVQGALKKIRKKSVCIRE